MPVKSSILAFASRRMPRLSSRMLASAGYTLNPADIGPPQAFTEWTAATAQRQDRAWQAIVTEVKAGNPRADVEALYLALTNVETSNASLLEVGCGGGYYGEIIIHRFPTISYRGLDFIVGSAYDLPFDNDAVDIVMDGVALLHMPDWRAAITQYGRVARRSVILHGVTITDRHPTTQFAKYAYGQPSYELVHNRDELEAVCAAAGLSAPVTIPGLGYDLEPFIGVPSTEETWLMTVG